MIIAPSSVPTVLETNGKFIKTAVYPIGAWNMDAAASTTVNHSLPIDQVVDFQAIIINDIGDEILNIRVDLPGDFPQGGIWLYPANFELERLAGGFFDKADWDDAVMNRGWIHVKYFD